MTAIADKNDLPDFSGVQPFVKAEDLAGMDQAIAEFDGRLAGFRAAAQQAETAVQLTLAWVGVGEKLVNLVGAIVQKRLADQNAALPQQERLGQLQIKLNQLASIHAEIKRWLPMLSG